MKKSDGLDKEENLPQLNSFARAIFDLAKEAGFDETTTLEKKVQKK